MAAGSSASDEPVSGRVKLTTGQPVGHEAGVWNAWDRETLHLPFGADSSGPSAPAHFHHASSGGWWKKCGR